MNLKINEEYENLKSKYKYLVDKYEGIIVERSAVFEAIDLVLSHYYGSSFHMVDASEKADGSARFIYIDGSIKALAEYTNFDDRPILLLSFIVDCLPNISAYVHSYVKEYVDVPVVSEHVFYLKKDKFDYQILYGKDAINMYNTALSDSIYKDRCKQELAMQHLQKLEKHQLH